jgi:hypothetical protein
VGDIADYISIDNSISINDLQRRQQIQMRLDEFRERTDRLACETGVSALGFFGFEKENPTPRLPSSLLKKITYTALLGIGLGLISGFALLPVCVGAALGLILGCIPESETSRLSRAVNRYDGYLTRTEEAAQSQVRSVPLTDMGTARATNHAQTILAEREQAATAMRGM